MCVSAKCREGPASYCGAPGAGAALREFALDLLPRDPGARRLREIADDLEAKAEALERQRGAP
jgi:hypothetical protein